MTGDRITDAEASAGETRAADPFATDIFAAHSSAEAIADAEDSDGADESTIELRGAGTTRNRVAWHACLPRLSAEEARLAELRRAVPTALAPDARRTIAAALAYFTRAEEFADESVRVETIDACETGLSIESVNPRSIFVNVAVEPTADRLAFAVPVEFAARFISRVLGAEDDGDGTVDSSSRTLSTVERAVIEFVCLDIARRLNRDAGAEVLRVHSIDNNAPSWLSGGGSGDFQFTRGVQIVARITIAESIECLARGFIPATTLGALAARTNNLLREREATIRRREFARLATDVPARLLIGETEVTAADVAALEGGDIVLVTRPRVERRGAKIGGRAELLVGDGGNVRLAGTLDEQIAARDTAELVLRLETVSSTADAESSKEHLGMNETGGGEAENPREKNEEPAADEAAGGEAAEDGAALGLENLMLTLRVELGARRLSLDELAALRPDAIIELGCAATDPVNLVVENRQVARGELMDIEGRLGVRVTHVLR